MKNRIFTIIFILLITLTPTVFAANNSVTKIKSDIYEETEKYLLDSEVDGNVYLSSDIFEMSSISSIRGNLFLRCETAHIKSYVSYSNSYTTILY